MNIPHMDEYGASSHLPGLPLAAFQDHSRPDHRLILRQQPQCAKVALSKDKDRKPVDPPPIIELQVSDVKDPNQIFLHSPYYFMSCTLIKGDEKDEKEPNPAALLGTLVSSLHRLKDLNNIDGAFFIFGDLSVKVAGTFRLHFTLYEIRDLVCTQRAAITSSPFTTHGGKTFPGLTESTALTRTFSDQGVRLRLRKDSRSVSTRKRNNAAANFARQFSIHDQTAAQQDTKQPAHTYQLGQQVVDDRAKVLATLAEEPSTPLSHSRGSLASQPSAFFDPTSTSSSEYPTSTGSPYQDPYLASSYEPSHKRPRLYTDDSSHVYHQTGFQFRGAMVSDPGTTLPPFTTSQTYNSSTYSSPTHLTTSLPFHQHPSLGLRQTGHIQLPHPSLPTPPLQQSMDTTHLSTSSASPNSERAIWGHQALYRTNSHGGEFGPHMHGPGMS